MKFPKILHLTCKDKDNITNPVHNKCIERFKEMYTDYEIRIRDNKDIYEMMEKDYPEHIEQIKEIKIGAVLADIFRYYILFKEGGVYADMDCYAHQNIDNLFLEKTYHGDDKNIVFRKKYVEDKVQLCNNKNILFESEDIELYTCQGHLVVDDTHKLVLCYEFHPDYNSRTTTNVCQWFMIAEPEQPLLQRILSKCFDNLNILVRLNISSRSYIKTVLDACGPGLVTKIVLNASEEELESVKILPTDYFCVGSNGLKKTKNSYVEHLFTSTWHPRNIRKEISRSNGIRRRPVFTTSQFSQGNKSFSGRRMFSRKKFSNFKLT